MSGLIAIRPIPHSVTTLDGDFTVITTPGRVEADVRPEDDESDIGVTGDVFRAAMRTLPGGVVMVTTRIGGRPWGLTISSCCSITAEPPQVLISLQERTASCQQILRDGRFGIGILSSEHRSLAELGAKSGVAKFIDEHCGHRARARLASPMIAEALCHLDCRVTHVHRVGDHRLFIGVVAETVLAEDVTANDSSPSRSPLVYFDRDFWALGAPVAR
jgi:flavin reductase (DIM6/NTAB) family NADH-FMN oxidoreductase RutF